MGLAVHVVDRRGDVVRHRTVDATRALRAPWRSAPRRRAGIREPSSATAQQSGDGRDPSRSQCRAPRGQVRRTRAAHPRSGPRRRGPRCMELARARRRRARDAAGPPARCRPARAGAVSGPQPGRGRARHAPVRPRRRGSERPGAPAPAPAAAGRGAGARHSPRRRQRGAHGGRARSRNGRRGAGRARGGRRHGDRLGRARRREQPVAAERERIEVGVTAARLAHAEVEVRALGRADAGGAHGADRCAGGEPGRRAGPRSRRDAGRRRRSGRRRSGR